MEVAHYSSAHRRIYPGQRQLDLGDSSADQDRLSYRPIVVHLPTLRHSSSLDLLVLIVLIVLIVDGFSVATSMSTGVGPTQSIDIAFNIGQRDSLSALRTPFSISKSRSKDGTAPC